MKHLFTVSVFGFALLALSNSTGAQKKSSAAPNLVPIFDVPSGYLLGGSRGGKWQNSKVSAAAIKGSATYRLFSATKALGNARASQPKSEGAPCDETLFSKFSPSLSNAEFALGGTHKALPRGVRIENTNQESYRKIVASILKARGISKPEVKITQLWRVDLDGDGRQEVLLSASRKADNGDSQSIQPASRAGDYSLVLLRKIVRGRVQNILLEGEFYPRAKEFNAPGFYQIAAVFDANGDDKMEVLIRGRYYEGIWTNLYQISGEKPRKVLTQGCGA